jgi:hypothetical protein
MRRLSIIVVAFLVIAASWSALWFYAAHSVDAGFDAWFKSEDEHGRAWTCPDREVGGYPFELTIHCNRPTFEGHALGQGVRAEVAALEVDASVLHPHRAEVALQAPLAYRTSDGAADLHARWQRLAIFFDPLSSAAPIDLHGTDLGVDGEFGETGRQSGTATAIGGRFAPSGGDTDPAADVSITVQGASIPAVDEWLGGEAPIEASFAGRITEADVAGAPTPTAALEAWRAAGGKLQLARSQIGHGDASVTASGRLGLDEQHRPQGRLDASFVGLQPVLKRYGINADMVATGALLSALLGGHPQSGAANAVNLPINLEGGVLGVGPVRTPVQLQPLY